MVNAALPVGFRMCIDEMIMADCRKLGKYAVWQRGLFVACIRACEVKRNRVEGSEHSDVGEDGSVVLRMAVAVW